MSEKEYTFPDELVKGMPNDLIRDIIKNGPTKATLHNFNTAKAWLIRRHPFYGSFALSLKTKWTVDIPQCQVGATDGINLFLNPVGCHNLTAPEWRFLIVHEIMHVAHLHTFRCGKRDNKLWNVATDITINELIQNEVGMQVINGSLLPVDGPHYKWAKFQGQSPEFIYKDLYKDAKKVPAPSQGGGQDGKKDNKSGAQRGAQRGMRGGKSDSDGHQRSRWGDTKDQGQDAQQGNSSDQLDERAPQGTQASQQDATVTVDVFHGDVLPIDDMDEATRNRKEAEAKELIHTSAMTAKAMGDDSALVQRIVGNSKPRIPWQMQLQQFVSDLMVKDDYTWQRPNRRFVPQGIYYPVLGGKKPPKLMAAVIDVSVSISQAQAKEMIKELGNAIATHPHLSFELFFVDTAITGRQRVGHDDLPLNIDISVGGGTCFRPAFEAIDREGLDVSGLIYLTDMACNTYAPEPDFPVMWLNFHRALQPGAHHWPPYGEVVNMLD